MQVIFNYIDAKFPTLVRKLDLIQSRISCNINPIYILLFLKSSFPHFFENCAFYLEIVSNAWTRQFSMGEDEKIVYDIFALCFCNTCCTFEKKGLMGCSPSHPLWPSFFLFHPEILSPFNFQRSRFKAIDIRKYFKSCNSNFWIIIGEIGYSVWKWFWLRVTPDGDEPSPVSSWKDLR